MDSKLKIGVFTKDRYLLQRVRLEVMAIAEVEEGDHEKEYDAVIRDIDTESHPKKGEITLSRAEDCDLKVPFAIGGLCDLIIGRGRGPLLSYSAEEGCAFLSGRRIRLTDVEGALLSKLIEGGGEYISRGEILESVWQGEKDGGVINVYIHYLREKLEKGGEKIILSSRNLGYCIDKKYLGGENA